MSCSNCFNGCATITSDQCVKYTGPTIASLGITNGDSLYTIEQAITNTLTSIIGGEGVIPVLDQNLSICTLVAENLPLVGDITLNDYIEALIKSACDLQDQVTDVVADITLLEGTYTVGCLEGVTGSSGTHAIVQAIITKLCELEDSISTIQADLDTNYVLLDDLDGLIDAHLAETNSSTLMRNKMVPYTVMPFYAPASYLQGKFDVNGAGIGDWAKIYLCNGQNGTPDMRGRVPVGTTSGMAGGNLDSEVDPASGNPSYSMGSKKGVNKTFLTNTSQIPKHNHIATVTVTNNHYHHTVAAGSTNSVELTTATPIIQRFSTGGTDDDYSLKGLAGGIATIGKTSLAISPDTVTVTNGTTGGDMPHDNYQPGIGVYYIMYIP